LKGAKTLKQILIIAANSFKNALKDKVFITITILFLVLSIVSVFIGSSTKNAEMKAYQDIVQLLKTQGAQSFPEAPQIFPLAILQNIIQYITMIGAVLAVFLGFDAFNGERENGTLKLMLTRPLYRDHVISGKIFGGAFVIGLLLGITLIFNTILFIAVSGLIPDLNELSRLFIFIVIGFLYMMSFYIASLYVSIKVRNRGFGFMTMMIVWVIVSFVIPQLADSQRSFAYSLNSTAQTVTQMPSDTIVSKTIEMFSPAVQFKNIGRDLLQVVPETSSMNVFEILVRQALSLLYMLAPGVVMLFVSYRAVQKEAVL
jgi:ABC-2 type transport system permease protein